MMTPKFINLYEYWGELSYKIFPKAGTIEHIKKLKQEADELISNPDDIEEYADCLLCLIAGARKKRIDPNDLIEVAYKKAMINERREWRELPDGTHQHIKK